MKKIALITGASSGIGKEFTVQISKRYQKLDEIWLIARRKERLALLEKEISIPIKIIELDLTKQEGMRSIKELLYKEQPQIRFLINCAGFGKVGEVTRMKEEEQLDMIRLNCIALTFLSKECIKYMKGGSHIVNMGSIASFFPVFHFAVYAATKAYVLSFSRALRFELNKRDISVTTVCPGPVNTEFFHVAEKTGYSAWYKDCFLAQPQKVVAKALDDIKRGRELSIYKGEIYTLRVFSKLFPHRFMLWAMEWIETFFSRKNQNNL